MAAGAGGQSKHDGGSPAEAGPGSAGALAEAGAPYAVGYGRPPKHTRFKPGQSGNPSGRRRKPLSLAREFFEVLHEPVTLGEGEACETVAKQRAILRALAAKAMEGDPRAIAKAIQLTQWITGFVPNYHVVAPVGWPKDEPEDEPEDESGDEPE